MNTQNTLRKRSRFFLFLTLTLCLNSFSTNCLAQTNGATLIANLNQLYIEQMSSPTVERSNTIFSLWKQNLSNQSLLEYDFSSLQYCKVLKSEKEDVLIVSWADPYHHPTPKYYGFVVLRNKKGHTIWELPESNKKIDEQTIYRANQWYGSVFYKLIENKTNGKTIYTLLGWSPLNPSYNQKVIDIVTVSHQQCTFGEKRFVQGEQTTNRIHFAYSKQTSMSLNEQKGEIVFDHLAPSTPQMKGVYEFYGPDMTFDKLIWKKGNWNRVEIK